MRLTAVYAVSKSSVQALERAVLPRSCASDNNDVALVRKTACRFP